MFSRTRQKIVLTTVLALILFLAGTLGMIYVSNWFAINRQNSEMLERYIGLYSLESPPGQSLPELPPDDGTGGAPGDGTPEKMPDLPPDDGTGGAPGGGTPEGMPELPPDDGTGGAPGDGTPEGMPELPPVNDPSQETGSSGAIYQLSSFYSAAFSPDLEVLAVDAGLNGLYTKEQIIETARMILGDNRSSGHRSHLLYRVDRREDYTLVAFMDMTLTDNNMWSLFIHTLVAGAVAIAILAVIAVRMARRIIEPLEENDRRQKQFISDAGHELKTPIAVISANAEILERQVGSSEWLENIQYENWRMGELVTGLLDLSRAENASVPMEALDLSKLVEREVLPFESVAFEQGLMIESGIAPDIRVTGNPAQLRQLVSILTDNAIRHGKGGKAVRVCLTSDRKNAVLTVTNAGEIPQEKMEKLFDRFYRADESRGDRADEIRYDRADESCGDRADEIRYDRTGHYGLGLSIAKAIAESHGGKIRAASEGGEVRFTVAIPVEK